MAHWSLRRLSRVSLVVACTTLGSSAVFADPLLFFGTHHTIDSSPTRLDLFTNPGATLTPSTYEWTIFPPVMIFGTFVDFAGGESVTDTIRWTYQEEGTSPRVFSQTFTTGPDPISLGFVVAFQEIHRTGELVPATLTVDLLHSSPDFLIPGGTSQGQLVDSFTYSFNTQTSVPEPSTLVLLLSGGAAAAAAARRRASRPRGRPGTPVR